MSRTNSNFNKRGSKSNTSAKKFKCNTKNGRSKEESVMSESEVRKKGLENDPNWYFTDSTLANQASQLSFNRFLGSDTSKLGDYVVPTISVLMLNPSPGNTYPMMDVVSSGKSSGFNMAMTKLYNRLSMKSGRNMAYAPQDVGTMYLAQGELISLITHVRRVFAVAQTYNMRNRMFPKNVIKALGFDPDDFFNNFSNYRMRFNTLLASINQIPIMTESGYMRKCNAIYSGIYMDSESSMSQIYLLVPYSTWMLDETVDQRGTALVTTNVCAPESDGAAGKVWKFHEFMSTIMEPMVRNLLHSSTLNLVYADMLNLAKYENIKFAAFEPIQDSDVVIPQYDLMMLKQIHNMVFLGAPVGSTESALHTISNNVVHDPNNNCISYSPAFRSWGNVIGFSNDGSEIIIDTDNADPDLAERIELTRFTAAYSNTWEGEGPSRVNVGASMPDHYGVIWLIYGNHVDTNHSITLHTYYYDDLPKNHLYWVSQFDWHPIILEHAQKGDYNEIKQVFADLGSYTTVRSPYLRRLNQLIYMGLFEIRG